MAGAFAFRMQLIPNAHSLLFLVDFTALLAVKLRTLILISVLVLLLKQPRKLGHKGADGTGRAGDIHWCWITQFLSHILSISRALFLGGVRTIPIVILFFCCRIEYGGRNSFSTNVCSSSVLNRCRACVCCQTCGVIFSASCITALRMDLNSLFCSSGILSGKESV